VATRTHARRGDIPIAPGDAARIAAALPAEERRALEVLFRRLRRAHEDPPRALRDGLATALAPILGRLDPAGGEREAGAA
jgi:hypothetical protein